MPAVPQGDDIALLAGGTICYEVLSISKIELPHNEEGT
jgi:hypothetical protein